MNETGGRTRHGFSFQAMNTGVEAVLLLDHDGNRQSEEDTADWFRYAEETFSRFLPDSELSRINRLAGSGPVLVSDTMLEVLALAGRYRELTEGVFDPLIGSALRRIGYDRSYEKLPPKRQVPAASFSRTSPEPYILDSRMKSVRLSPAAELDLGGIVKSWTVKRASLWLRSARGVRCGMINAGGDLTVWNDSADSGWEWQIGIQNPWRPESDIGQIRFKEGSAATSSRMGRRWTTALGVKHHLIDPMLMDSAESPVVQCTVVGPDPVECEIWSKTICILGAGHGTVLMAKNAPSYEAVWFTGEGILNGTPSIIRRLEYSNLTFPFKEAMP